MGLSGTHLADNGTDKKWLARSTGASPPDTSRSWARRPVQVNCQTVSFFGGGGEGAFFVEGKADSRAALHSTRTRENGMSPTRHYGINPSFCGGLHRAMHRLGGVSFARNMRKKEAFQV